MAQLEAAGKQDAGERGALGVRPSPIVGIDEPQGRAPEVRTEGLLAGQFNDGLSLLNSGQKSSADKTFKQFGDDLKATLIDAYQKGGISSMQEKVRQVDGKVIGENTGLYMERSGDQVKVTAFRPVPAQISELLDKANASSSSDSFTKFQDNAGNKYWMENLAKINIDLSQLNPKGENLSGLEKATHHTLEENAEIAARGIKDDMAKFAGKGVGLTLMNKLQEMTDKSHGAPELELAINKALEGSGLSVSLSYKDGLPGIHRPDSVVQTIVELKSGNQTVARQLEQHDTVKAFGANKSLPFEQTGIFKDK